MTTFPHPAPRTVTVYHSLTDIASMGDTDTIIGDPVVPGWTLPVRDLFA